MTHKTVDWDKACGPDGPPIAIKVWTQRIIKNNLLNVASAPSAIVVSKMLHCKAKGLRLRDFHEVAIAEVL